MIIDKTVKIKISNNKNFYNYIDEFNNIKSGDVIEIPIEYLYEGSYQKIHVKCDVCEKEKYLKYKYYIKNTKNQNYYCCSQKCAQNKIKTTNLEKYGVDTISKSYEIKEKIKKTNLEKYGVENPMQSDEIKKKYKKMFLEKYNVEHLMYIDDIKNKIKETNIKKYGVENIFQLEEIKDKIKKTNIKKYGVENPSQSEEIKNNIKKINKKKFGYENVFQSEEIKDKIKETNIKKYGTEYYVQSNYYKEKYINNYLKKYNETPDSRNFKIKLYRNKISSLTNNLKNELFEQWNGFDFYDNEYIKDNFNLYYLDKNYPTIDHKISVNYGFNNNISPEEISKIENLCVTKRSLNSKKQDKCYEGKKKD